MPSAANNKRRYNYIWISLVILIFGIIFIPKIVDRLKSDSVSENDRMAVGKAEQDLAFIVNDGKKRKVPEFAFMNQDSTLITNETYLGKVYVVDFFFTTCPTICPIMTKNLVDLQKTFFDKQGFGIASFTINPRYDTVEILTEYAKKYGIEDPDWHLLTGEQEAIYQLANKGFYMVANENGEAPGGFEHSGMFALVDKEGYLRSRTDEFGNPIIYYRGTITTEDGVNEEGEPQQITILKEDIKKLLAE